MLCVSHRFLEYIDWSRRVHSQKLTNGWARDSDSFVALVKEFLNSKAGEFFYSDVKYNDDETAIYSTILLTGYSNNIAKSLQGVDMMNDLKSRAMKNVPDLRPVLIGDMFPFYEGLEIVQKDVVKNLVLVSIAVLLIVGFMLVNATAAVLVVIVVALTDVFLIGKKPLMFIFHVQSMFATGFGPHSSCTNFQLSCIHMCPWYVRNMEPPIFSVVGPDLVDLVAFAGSMLRTSRL